MSAKKFRIKRDDTVRVIAGKHKGAVGRVLRIVKDTDRVVVEGVNIVKRHQKPVGERAGGIVHKEAAIHISNVQLWDAGAGRPIKVGYSVGEDGKKLRIDRKTGATVD
jgi:large subunit ribosomal protein L24